jgi:hypothetical protein
MSMALKPKVYRTLVQGLTLGHTGKLVWVSQDTTWRGLCVFRQRKELNEQASFGNFCSNRIDCRICVLLV